MLYRNFSKSVLFLLCAFFLHVSFAWAADITDITMDSTHVREASPIGKVVGNLTSIGGNVPYVYSLVAGSGDSDNALFTIDNNHLKLNFVPDHENPVDADADNVYNVRIESESAEAQIAQFPEVDYSSARNKYDGLYNSPNNPNYYAFSTIDTNGHIIAWGDVTRGGAAPTNASNTQFSAIHSVRYAFAALDTNGHITAWGDPSEGGVAPPNAQVDSFTQIYSSGGSFAALDQNGHITAWGSSAFGGIAPPNVQTGTFTSVYSNFHAFAALDTNGHITAWGNGTRGGTAPPNAQTTEFTKIYSTDSAFTAIDTNKHITAWGHVLSGGTAPPNAQTTEFTKIYSTANAFVALDTNGHITTWGNASNGGTPPPNAQTDIFTDIYPASYAAAALDTNGHITTWGNPNYGGTPPPNAQTDTFTSVYTNFYAFAALDQSGHITAWGDPNYGGTAPANAQSTEFVEVFATKGAFAALDTNGHITAWGDPNYGGTAPTNAQSVQFTQIYSTDGAFAALDQSGKLTTWGNPSHGGTPPTLTSTHQKPFTITVRESQNNQNTPINLNTQVKSTLTLDCYDTTTASGDHTVTLGTTTHPGHVTAGTPAIGQSTCTVTTNDTNGYYLTLQRDNPQHTLTHNTHTIQDLPQFPTTQNWTTPTTKGLGFSVITFPDPQTTNNTLQNTWNNTNTCTEANTDTNLYAGIPQTHQTIAAVTQYEQNPTTTHICYKLDIPASQPSGHYTGSVTYTALADASSYIQ